MIGELRKHRVFFAAATLVLFCSYALNVFGGMGTAAFVQNFKDSEALVVNQIRCRGEFFAGQMLELKRIEGSNIQAQCDPALLKPYSSQFGLQGKFHTYAFRAVHKLTNIPVGAYVVAAELATALLSAASLALFALWVRARFGQLPAAVVTGLLALSPMLVGFARNLYWALPLLILPFMYALYFYRTEATRKYQVYFWLGLGGLLFLRYLCGYEYITSITIMAAAGLLYALYMAKADRRKYVLAIVGAGAVSVAAFVLAFAVHVQSLYAYAGSYGRAVSIIEQRALERTARSGEYLAYPITGLRTNLNDIYTTADTYVDFAERTEHPSQLWASLASFLNYALMPVLTVPIALVQPLATYVQSMAALSVVLILLYRSRSKWVSSGQRRQVEALFLMAAAGFVGYLSWLVLARSHSLVHGHINGILLYLPFALAGYAVIGLYAANQFTKFKKRLRR